MTHEISLAGNFGEPRPNHFHGGLDFRTEGVEGKKVLAISDGYVSRLTVGLFGFGNAIYVTHPDGYTSVYCHLQRFTPRLEELLKKWQYEHEQYEADVRLSPSDCPVAQGQLIAISGNTGHSFGPHLHMEIHDTRTWAMYDPMEFVGAHINDTVAPQIHGIKAYPVAGQGVFNRTSQPSILQSQPSSPDTAWGLVGFGIYADDYMQGSYNHYGIRLTTLTVDGREVFRSDVNGIPYRKNRMVNSWGDYYHFYKTNHWYMKSFIEPGNTLPILFADEQRGLIRFDEERDYHIEYVLSDFFGNTTRRAFTVRGQRMEIPAKTIANPRMLMRWNQTNIYSRPGMQLVIPYGLIGDDIELSPSVQQSSDGYSPLYTFYHMSCPLFYDAELSIAVHRQVADPQKLYIVCHNGRDRFQGGSYHDGWVTGRLNDLGGRYELAYDGTPPVITLQNEAGWSSAREIRITVKDDQSGLKSCKAYVDGQFVLLKPVAKSNVLLCRLADTPVAATGAMRRLRITAVDQRDNEKTIETNIQY